MSNTGLFAILATLVLVFLCACVGVGAVAYFAVTPDATAIFSPQFAPLEPAPEEVPIVPEEQEVETEAEAVEPEPRISRQDIQRQPIPTPLPGDEMAILQLEERAVHNVYERVGPSVVNITILGAQGDPLSGGQGSGFVWDREGHIVTNNHVVMGGGPITVQFSDRTEVPAEIVGTDPDADLAVIKVDVPAELLYPVEVANSSELFIGQRVIAIGNPFGFERTVTTGIVSAVGRTVTQMTNFALPNLIQTDAAINPGNSGGPLLDIAGRVVGVNSLIFSQTPQANSGVGFAIPVDTVKLVVPQLIATGEYEHPYIGVLATSLTPSVAVACEIEEGTLGVLVQEVVPNSPAAEAGVEGGDDECLVEGFPQPIQTGGDLIVGIDDVRVESFDDLVNYLDRQQVGDTVILTVLRDGETVELDVVLGPRPDTLEQETAP